MQTESLPGVSRTTRMLENRRLIMMFILLVLLHGLLLWPVFFPHLGQISKDDETWYIISGRSLIHGYLPDYAHSPLSSFFYALIYIPFEDSPLWLVHSCSVGRILCFILLWAGFGLITSRFESSERVTSLALLFVSPVMINILWNPADCLFTIFAGFCFWQVLSYLQSRKRAHIWLASFFLGVSALARSDGLILFGLFLVIILCLTSKRRLWALIAAILPFLLVLSTYGLVYYLKYGECDLRLQERTYLAFEQGQGVLFPEQHVGGNLFYDGQETARRLFGTPEQSDLSIVRAILRNPAAFTERLFRNISRVPEQIMIIYGEVHGYLVTVGGFGKGLGLIIVLLAVRGGLVLVERKQFARLALLIAWSLHLGPYLLTFFRNGYFLFDYFIIIYTAALGINSIVHVERPTLERTGWTILLVIFCLVGLLLGRPLLVHSSLVFLAGLWLIWLIQGSLREQGNRRTAGIVLFMCLLLCLRGSFPLPMFDHGAEHPEEKIVCFLRQHYEPNTKIAGVSSHIILCAGMEVTYLPIELRSLESPEIFLDWLVENGVRAVLVDRTLAWEQPSLYRYIEKMPACLLEPVYQDVNMAIKVLEITSDN